MSCIKFCLALVFCSLTACCQQYKWNKFLVDDDRVFEITSENEIIDLSMFNEPSDTIRASLTVNDDPANTIGFSTAHLAGKKLEILIHDTSEAYHHEFQISIVKDKYFIRYKFIVSGDSDDEGVIIPHNSKLVLNTCKFERGKEIRGFIDFKGKCAMPCNEEWIRVKGNFKAIPR